MQPLTISLPDYLYKKLTQQAQTHETSLEELVIFQLRRDETRNTAMMFLQKHVGRCLTIREPIFRMMFRLSGKFLFTRMLHLLWKLER